MKKYSLSFFPDVTPVNVWEEMLEWLDNQDVPWIQLDFDAFNRHVTVTIQVMNEEVATLLKLQYGEIFVEEIHILEYSQHLLILDMYHPEYTLTCRSSHNMDLTYW